ncbi:MAG TPA: hypothetical protein VGA22_00620 [Gemmatimonadales bacterium]|jgi:hypothetical protein
MTRLTLFRCAGAALLLGIGACAPDEPMPGEMKATLVSPNGPEGAAVIEIAGNFPDIVPSGGVYLYSHVADGVTRIVLVRQAPDNIVYWLFVDDTRNPPETTVLQVSAPDNTLRSLTAGYHVQYETVGAQ